MSFFLLVQNLYIINDDMYDLQNSFFLNDQQTCHAYNL